MTQEMQTTTNAADPWSDLDRALDTMRQRFFDSFGFVPFGSTGTIDPSYFRPARTDVTDTGASYRVVAEIPGIPKENLDIRIRGTNVEIRGENGESKDETTPEYVHRERVSSRFYRTLELPEPVVATEAKAKVVNGLLELDLPKLQPTPSPDEVKVAVQ